MIITKKALYTYISHANGLVVTSRCEYKWRLTRFNVNMKQFLASYQDTTNMTFKKSAAIIFDINTILRRGNLVGFSISTNTLAELRSSSTWQDLNRGQITQEECFHRLADQYSIPSSEISNAVRLELNSMAQDEDVFSSIRELKKVYPHARVYVSASIPKEDWNILRAKAIDWDVFHGVLLSHSAGTCTPEPSFYRSVLASTDALAEETIFVGAELADVIATLSVGFKHSFTLESVVDMRRRLKNRLGDPCQRAREWLQSQPKGLFSESDSGMIIPDNFSQLLTLEVTDDM